MKKFLAKYTVMCLGYEYPDFFIIEAESLSAAQDISDWACTTDDSPFLHNSYDEELSQGGVREISEEEYVLLCSLLSPYEVSVNQFR